MWFSVCEPDKSLPLTLLAGSRDSEGKREPGSEQPSSLFPKPGDSLTCPIGSESRQSVPCLSREGWHSEEEGNYVSVEAAQME